MRLSMTHIGWDRTIKDGIVVVFANASCPLTNDLA
jgi:hypothetical protein